MDPHNDFDKHDHPPVFCRCGHERDDHGSRTEMRRGEKIYIQKCAHCACEVFVDVDGPLSRMMKDIPVYPTAIHCDLDGPAGGASGCNQANKRTPQSTGTLCDGGVTVRWCPRCGACTCPEQDGTPDRWVEDSLCPIHGPRSSHDERVEETQDSVLLAVQADRAAIADFILSCREGGNMTNVVQVFDVLASKIRNGEHLTVPEK